MRHSRNFAQQRAFILGDFQYRVILVMGTGLLCCCQSGLAQKESCHTTRSDSNHWRQQRYLADHRADTRRLSCGVGSSTAAGVCRLDRLLVGSKDMNCMEGFAAYHVATLHAPRPSHVVCCLSSCQSCTYLPKQSVWVDTTRQPDAGIIAPALIST